MAIKKIKDIYPGYFQKSKVFLHPALGHKRGSSVTPIETYLSWGDDIKISDGKLIELYHLRDDEEFLRFEDQMLLSNPLFSDYKEVSIDKAAYIFDFADHLEDFYNVIHGNYSKISQDQKTKIKEFYGASTHNYAFIDSYLYPQNYFIDYADFLTCKAEDVPGMYKLLTEVGELCSKPNFEKEGLKMSVKTMDLRNL